MKSSGFSSGAPEKMMLTAMLRRGLNLIFDGLGVAGVSLKSSAKCERSGLFSREGVSEGRVDGIEDGVLLRDARVGVDVVPLGRKRPAVSRGRRRL